MNLRDLRSSRSRSRRGALALGLAVATVLAAGAAAPVSARDTGHAGGAPVAGGVRATLPAPTGPHAIGTFSTRLVDRSRHDPWVTSVPYRELMVNVWYPARATGGHGVAPYMAKGAAARWNAAAPHGIPKGSVDWAGMRTHAREKAPLDKGAARGGKLPVLVYSAGAGDPRTWGTALVEELASRGYVVVTVDHTYESPGVQFPDGSVKDNKPLLDALAQTPQEKLPQLMKKVLDARVADDKFVLDRLGSLPRGLGEAVDHKRVGMVGHSAGGMAAAETMYEDKRVKAGVDLDGTLEHNSEPKGTNLTPVARHGLDQRPFLLMGRDGSDHTSEPSWGAFWKHSPGWKRDLNLRGSRHQTYTDLAAVLPQAGVGRDVIEANIGTVDPARATSAQRAYVVSFFDRWLGGRDDHLLDGPSDRFPEVRFVRL
ncbi:alpha/beta hydrolase family protein [Streptomyces aureoverticillatus]|uniref:alpha/beta hydrolase family protein n=1 Tax=Streptomyces aureoverticillatus TaxID=66871 RepID=UPI0013DCB99C|nr:hydrolase [Streptomyces aureoverticillatus]QIB43771.1 hydrolase [Streptomyces aureoverticillatus]